MNRNLLAGLFVIFSVLGLIYMTTWITQEHQVTSAKRPFVAELRDATGLIAGSKIKVAGLDVGELQVMKLENGKARIEFDVIDRVRVYADARVRLRSIGYLGDKYLELLPGTPQKPELTAGSVIQASTDGATIEGLTDNTSRLVDNLNILTEALNQALLSKDRTRNRLAEIMDNLDDFSEELASTDDLGELTEDLREITDKINRGEGSVGKLINDPETVDRLNTTLSGVDRMVQQVNEINVGLRAQSALLTANSSTRNELNLRIGLDPTTRLVVGGTYRPAAFPGESPTTKPSDVTLNAQLGKTFGPVHAKLGLFEGTGGFGLELGLPADIPLTLFGEIYRFRSGHNAQINAGATVRLIDPLELWAGGDFISDSANSSFFIGAAIDFSFIGNGKR